MIIKQGKIMTREAFGQNKQLVPKGRNIIAQVGAKRRPGKCKIQSRVL
jgi:hypothetical protein